MKKITRVLFISAVLIVALCTLCCAEIYSGDIKSEYNGKIIVDNSWIFDSESGLLTITSNNDIEYNESGRTADYQDGSWKEHMQSIRKVQFVGNFDKISYGAFQNCSKLENIILAENTCRIDSKAFSGCAALTKISVENYQSVDNTADLRNIVGLAGREIFKDTAIKTFYISAGIAENHVKNLDIFPAGTEKICGIKGSYIETFAIENDIAFDELPSDATVTVKKNGRTVGTYSVPYGRRFTSYKNPSGALDLLFVDAAFQTLYDNASYTVADTELYAKEILSFTGFSVRTREYAGLRTIYDFNFVEPNNAQIFEVGVLGGYGEYALNDVTVETEDMNRIVVYQDGELVGKLLSENGDIKTFAATAVGFEDEDGTLNDARAKAGIIYRGYIRIKKADGDTEQVFYTDSIVTSLRNISDRFLSSDVAKVCTEKEKEFIKRATNIELLEDDALRYSREQLKSVLSDVYNSEMLLIGEQIEHNQYPSDRIASFSSVGSDAPSILGVDAGAYGMKLQSMNDAKYKKYLTELLDYAYGGGIITICSHIACPNGSVGDKDHGCRGTLESEQEWRDLVTEGTALNTELKELLNVDAKLLRDLNNNGIPVLFRPFHEMNGSWFWWNVGRGGTTIDSKLFRDLWIYVHNYYTNELELTNLIWVYSPNYGAIDVDYCYPGDEYVDMAGLDWYAKSSTAIFEPRKDSGTVDYNVMMAHNKPVSLTEFGFSGGFSLTASQCGEIFSRMMQNGMHLTYVLGWNEVFSGMDGVAEFMKDEYILTLSDMRGLFN